MAGPLGLPALLLGLPTAQFQLLGEFGHPDAVLFNEALLPEFGLGEFLLVLGCGFGLILFHFGDEQSHGFVLLGHMLVVLKLLFVGCVLR